jgi:hypothetical protein
MRTYKNILFILTSLILISGCAAGNIQVPEKYALDGQLEQVNSIYKYKITDWEKVDNQSLIIEAGPGSYYLLVLKIPSHELIFRNSISLSSTGSMIRAGLDDLIIYSAHMRVKYPIERIFKIKGRDQMFAIKDQLTTRKDEGHKDALTSRPDKPEQPKKTGMAI